MSWWQAAAANNARWCDLVARSHGLQTRSDREAWTCRSRTPPLYPDAVTLAPRPRVGDLLTRIDSSPGCSIKDSFAALDLRIRSFDVLFEADWIARPAAGPVTPPDRPRWRRIMRPDDLARWEDTWRGEAGPRGQFRAGLLDHDEVAVAAAEEDGRIIAGAVLSCGPSVVGMSNFFACSGAATDLWPGCLALAGTLFPGRTLVGYESGEALVQAERQGFQRIGHLRVWINGTS